MPALCRRAENQTNSRSHRSNLGQTWSRTRDPCLSIWHCNYLSVWPFFLNVTVFKKRELLLGLDYFLVQPIRIEWTLSNVFRQLRILYWGHHFNQQWAGVRKGKRVRWSWSLIWVTINVGSSQLSVAPWRSSSEGFEAAVDDLRLQWAGERIVVCVFTDSTPE